MRKNVFSVTQVNSYIKALIEEDVILSEIYLKGEISNFKLHSSGHMYFTLKDKGGSMNCVMFKSNGQFLDFMPKNGESVIAYGRIGVYEKTGQYQLYVSSMEQAGKGDLYERFEKLKLRLSEEGLFSDEYKKPIPENPVCISVITSPTGAAVRDIIKVSRKRNPGIKLMVIPCLVQGENAAVSIADAIDKANRYHKSDVIILGRGGGSIEDLWAFNEEIVARAIFESEIPIVSAVGHETDFTIADFVSDLRAATPSQAAEICVPDYYAQVNALNYCASKMTNSINYKVSLSKRQLEQIGSRPVMGRPLDKVYNSQIYLEGIHKNLHRNMQDLLSQKKSKLMITVNSLHGSSPLNIMSKGYSAVFKEERIVKNISNVWIDDEIKVQLMDGSFKARITDKNEDDGIGQNT